MNHVLPKHCWAGEHRPTGNEAHDPKACTTHTAHVKITISAMIDTTIKESLKLTKPVTTTTKYPKNLKALLFVCSVS